MKVNFNQNNSKEILLLKHEIKIGGGQMKESVQHQDIRCQLEYFIISSKTFIK